MPPKTTRSTTKKTKAAAQPRRRSGWARFGRGVLWALTVFASLAMVAASFGGNFQPSAIKGICLMILSFPAWLLLLVLVTILDLIWCRKALILCALTYIACGWAIISFCPLNVVKPSAEKYARCPKFSFMTYNVLGFMCQPDGTFNGYNPTLSYIINSGADVVNLQEVLHMSPYKPLGITGAQLDSLHSIYPYIIYYTERQALLSKYPAEAVHTPLTNENDKEISVFRLNIEGESVTLFNVHLQSYRLTESDKALYGGITRLKDPDGSVKETIKDVKTSLLDKVQHAAVLRSKEADRLCNYIEHFGGPNVIVAGDFNDVPGCYALRRLADCGMREVYPALGFGPMVTYNRDRFYFQIDHVLWRGNLQPLRITKGRTRLSDHYPLFVTFAITHDK